MFDTVLVANRGVIANRIIRTLTQMGIRAVAVYHEADYQADYVATADRSVSLGDGSVAETYLNARRLLEIAREEGVEAVHPGYGFLSENVGFAQACEDAGIRFIGPSADQIRQFGLKHEARRIAEAAGVPCIPGSSLLTDLEEALAEAVRVGYPVMLKSTAGGGGIGMQVCEDEAGLRAAWSTVRQLAGSFFSDSGVFLERYIARARHIEVQAFGDGEGTVVSLGERDCSAQRRNQKIIEETPAPNLPAAVREQLARTAEQLLASVNYRNAGTVEFIYDTDTTSFYFLEVNTRLQVEHGITEEVWGVDLVECMVRQAAGEMPPLESWRGGLQPRGHAMEVRVYAEDPKRDFLPSPGLISEARFPSGPGIRLETWVTDGSTVPALFDPMLAKLIVSAPDRGRCLETLDEALSQSSVYGVETNLEYAASVLATDLFRAGDLCTNSLAGHSFAAPTIRVIAPGTHTTIQDTGRPGYWHVGIPPSGPMDGASFALGNELVGNPPDAAGLEVTLTGPVLEFDLDTVIALTGAPIEATLDDASVPLSTPVAVRAGQRLVLASVAGSGARSYLAVAGGLRCPPYLGSRATFDLGQFGGHVGRALRAGDVLRAEPTHTSSDSPQTARALEERLGHHAGEFARAERDGHWTLRVIYGPHGAPDFFAESFIDTFFEAMWEVHYNSSRTGVRLIGPKPQWARETGGEAGLHPSNIHDNAYAFGTVDFTGDMPVILGPDGPSLGGFVCPATVVQADLWKLGQLRAGHKLRFEAIAGEDAVRLEASPERSVGHNAIDRPSPVLASGELEGDEVVVRMAGDHFVLVELGPMELDVPRRLRIHRLMLWLQANPLDGVREMTPGVRSLQIHYDSQRVPVDRLVQHIQLACASCTEEAGAIASRIVHLPLSWDDEVCRLAAERYTQSVWPDAPWCPSNLEFIRRVNGLDSIDEVKRIIFDASYLVLGLGDVYLGAPVATPLNPSHRLVTTKYNPARTWTAENSVGIGGAYLCIYGMEGPGGYQLFGRTVQMWNRYRRTDAFEQPWLLRFFDQIRFYEVSPEELLDIRRDFELGRHTIRIEQATFELSRYQSELKAHATEIQRFSSRRTASFEAEMADWRARGLDVFRSEEGLQPAAAGEAPAGITSIDSVIDGSVWEVMVAAGDAIEIGQTVCLIESMKMEVPVVSPVAGRIVEVHVEKGSGVRAGHSLFWVE